MTKNVGGQFPAVTEHVAADQITRHQFRVALHAAQSDALAVRLVMLDKLRAEERPVDVLGEGALGDPVGRLEEDVVRLLTFTAPTR